MLPEDGGAIENHRLIAAVLPAAFSYPFRRCAPRGSNVPICPQGIPRQRPHHDEPYQEITRKPYTLVFSWFQHRQRQCMDTGLSGWRHPPFASAPLAKHGRGGRLDVEVPKRIRLLIESHTPINPAADFEIPRLDPTILRYRIVDFVYRHIGSTGVYHFPN